MQQRISLVSSGQYELGGTPGAPLPSLGCALAILMSATPPVYQGAWLPWEVGHGVRSWGNCLTSPTSPPPQRAPLHPFLQHCSKPCLRASAPAFSPASEGSTHALLSLFLQVLLRCHCSKRPFFITLCMLHPFQCFSPNHLTASKWTWYIVHLFCLWSASSTLIQTPWRQGFLSILHLL